MSATSLLTKTFEDRIEAQQDSLKFRLVRGASIPKRGSYIKVDVSSEPRSGVGAFAERNSVECTVSIQLFGPSARARADIDLILPLLNLDSLWWTTVEEGSERVAFKTHSAAVNEASTIGGDEVPDSIQFGCTYTHTP